MPMRNCIWMAPSWAKGYEEIISKLSLMIIRTLIKAGLSMLHYNTELATFKFSSLQNFIEHKVELLQQSQIVFIVDF